MIIIRNGNKKEEDFTATPSKYPNKTFRDKSCRQCDEVFSPIAPSHHYCSDGCRDRASTDNYYTKTYGVSLKEVEEMFLAQGGKCAVCKQDGFKMRDEHKSSLNLDHCHNTGKVRGLLCHNCNRALGLLKDSTAILSNAIEYLEGATTIPRGSRDKCSEAHDTQDTE